MVKKGLDIKEKEGILAGGVEMIPKSLGKEITGGE